MSVLWHEIATDLGDLSFLPSGPASISQGSAGWSGFPNSKRLQLCPGPPRAAGGLSCREVHWYRATRVCRPSRYCVPVAPIRVAFRRGRYAAAVGAGQAWCAGGPPVVRIQPERRSREVPRGRLSVPPGEGVQLGLSQRSLAGVRPRGGRRPVSWARAQLSEGTAGTVGLEASGCRRGCPGRLSPARGPAFPSFRRGA